MPVITCRLGLDRADAALNRPVLVLRPPEVEELSAAVGDREVPLLRAFLRGGAGESSLGASELPALRAEVRRLLDELSAAHLPERLTRGVEAFARLTPLLDPIYRDGPPDRPSVVIYRVPEGP